MFIQPSRFLASSPWTLAPSPYTLVPIFLFALCFLTFDFASADPSSTNYAIAESYFPTASAGTITSTNYKVDEGSIDHFFKTTTTSTNYAAEGAFGIAGADLIPVIQNISPSAGRFFSDANADFTVTAVSPDSDTLGYLAKQDSTTKDGPQSSSNLVWALSSSDLGRRAVAIHVSDPDGTVVQNVSEYVFRRPMK